MSGEEVAPIVSETALLDIVLKLFPGQNGELLHAQI